MSTQRRRLKPLHAALAGLLLLAGCTGVPASSAPQSIDALDTRSAPAIASRAPNLDSDPRDIVQSFLEANASTSGRYDLASQYLTRGAAREWPGSDPTATIIANDYTTGFFDERRRTVTVYGRVLGYLDAAGIYTPSLQGTGQGGEAQPFVFDIAKVGSAFRIAKLHTGLLLTDDQFRDTYRQQTLYFYDLAGEVLVPDLRWSALVDRAQRAEWQLEQIVNGPRPDLEPAVRTDTLPARVDPRIAVKIGTTTRIEIPGSAELSPAVRDRLAAQLSQTLLETLAGRDMSIVDPTADPGGRPVRIPRVGGDTFSAADFAHSVGPSQPVPAVYYLANGRIRDDAGKPLPGPVNRGDPLTSVAVGQVESGGPLLVAGVTGSGDGARLLVGTQRDGLHQTLVRGRLTRPAFVPGRNEVWIGSGSRLLRIATDVTSQLADPVQILGGGGQIRALRFSPEGARVALVISGPSGVPQLYVGSVIRGAGTPHVDKLQQISPEGVGVLDVAWLDAFKLFAIGYLAGSGDSRTFETGVDGTDWANSTVGLPTPPDAVAAATSSSVWVSAGGFVWKQSGSAWLSAGATGQTLGTAPVYLE